MTDTEKALLLSRKTVSVASSVAGRLVQPVTVTNWQIASRCKYKRLLHCESCPTVLTVLKRLTDPLRAGRSGDRITLSTRFSAPVQTVPGTHPASYTVGTGSFPGVKRPGAWRWPSTPPSSAEVKERVELYLYYTSGLSWPVIGLLLAILYWRGWEDKQSVWPRLTSFTNHTILRDLNEFLHEI